MIKIQPQLAPKFNFAGYNNGYSILNELRIENAGAERVEKFTARLSSSPAFLKPKVWTFERLAPGEAVMAQDRDIAIDGDFLLNLSDSMRGVATFTVEQNGKTIAEASRDIELLAHNEWGGAEYTPELLAAFSTPNSPIIDDILRAANDVFKAEGYPSGIDGYQSGSRERARFIVYAIYKAICERGIAYSNPPASFEKNGQKIRLPADVWSGRIATCLDTTMLFCSALEQAGLHPVVVLPNEHALIGVWLHDNEWLSSVVIDEAEILRKRVELDELLLIETTAVTQQPAPSFVDAVNTGKRKIAVEHDATFNAAVDIKHARARKIKPLGMTGERPARPGASGAPNVKAAADGEAQTGEVLSPMADRSGIEDIPTTPEGRLERWKRKLLDLSARNPLLNHRSEKTSINLICPEPHKVEDKLAAGGKIKITSGADEMARAPDSGRGDIEREYARKLLDKDHIPSKLSKDELERRLIQIYRKAQTSLQEGGANTLYLAVGYLLWKPADKSDRKFRAPLLLLPIAMERQSARSGVKIVSHDDEPRFNPTLIEMLRKDFEIDLTALGQNENLPRDANGIDVVKILNHVRHEISDSEGFEVIEDVAIGHFSFSKYLMWKDLSDRADALRQNAVVRHLIDSSNESYGGGGAIGFVSGDEVDEKYKPADLLLPLPADSSQMAAIATAHEGKDFVLIGPPGTGKSQTISNLIAHMLGQGKTVLFVSEKTAALDVVSKRLHDIGLGDYCLELHSNKANKADALKKLKSAWENRDKWALDEWEREGDMLLGLRDKLNRYPEELHKKRDNGLSVYDAISEVAGRGDLLQSFGERDLWEYNDSDSPGAFDDMKEKAHALAVYVKEVQALLQSPLRLVAQSDFSSQWQSDIMAGATRLTDAIRGMEDALRKLSQSAQVPLPEMTLTNMAAIADLAGVVAGAHNRQTGYALGENASALLEMLNQAADWLRAYREEKQKLSCRYADDAWRNISGQAISERLKQADASWWLIKLIRRRSVIKDMQKAGALGKPDADSDCQTLVKLRAAGEAIDDLDRHLGIFTSDWKRHDSDTDKLTELRAAGERLRDATANVAESPAALSEIRAAIKALVGDSNDMLAPGKPIGDCLGDIARHYHDLTKAISDFEALSGRDSLKRYFEAENKSEKLADVCREVAAIGQYNDALRNWCLWQKARNDAANTGLGEFVDAIERQQVPPDKIEKTFKALYCRWWAKKTIDAEPALRDFSSVGQTDAIGRFRQADERFKNTTIRYIQTKAGGDIPYMSDGKKSERDAWGTLRREIEKKKRHLPIRQLMQKSSGALTALTPCFMMSPLSIAQYLPAGQAPFDVVIFDEASQITVWDAIGALARAKQVIVVGDPKQMPPTNFFARTDDDPDGDVDVEGDLESILTEMMGSGIPYEHINLHYRSRRESLIKFSNSKYYDDKLITFPAPVTPDRGVSLICPEGFYSRGAARHNKGEAEAIVNEIMRRLQNEDPAVKQASIGVVTFNTEQQSLIEDLLDKKRSENPDIEWAFAGASAPNNEPVFVKNLETVQGDERDVILFSITYGRDEGGKITMNFGPLNRDGGERRLNVAMTRARSEMMVFSTLKYDDIDLSRTQARAVKDLKAFLRYADIGNRALIEEAGTPGGEAESPFETAVADALRAHGWDVHFQVGVSAYRIDIGVAHPDKPGAYLAGVECDGAFYHSSRVARERDKVRQYQLENLGWKLARVWSTEWWYSKAETFDKLHRELTEILAAERRAATGASADNAPVSAV